MKNNCPFLQDNRECTYKRPGNIKYKKLPICIYGECKKCILWRKSLSEAINFDYKGSQRDSGLYEDEDDIKKS